LLVFGHAFGADTLVLGATLFVPSFTTCWCCHCTGT